MSFSGRSARRAAAVFASLSLLTVLPAAPALGITRTACVVTDLGSDEVYASLTGAIAAADSGALLSVRGVCTGDVTIDLDLTIVGIRPDGAAAPAIVGDGDGSVVTVNVGRTAKIVGLTITGGDAGSGGGIFVDRATLTLRDVTVRGNEAGGGGGIFVEAGTLHLRGTTAIRSNSARFGGGVLQNGGLLEMRDSAAIRDNRAVTYGGGLLSNATTIDLSDGASIHHNRAGGDSGYGAAGAFVDFGGTMTLRDSASVHHNSTPSTGGGILVKGTLVIQDSASVHHNTSGVRRSGAVELVAQGANTTSFTMAGSASVRQNTGGRGGGGVVSWQDCGDNAPILSGVAERTTGNTPKQLVLATSCPFV